MNGHTSLLPVGSSDDSFKKAIFFGIAGALGCLAGALLGEPLFALLPNAKDQTPKVDVLFVLDVTGSMQPQIDGVRKGIVDFASKLSEKGLDERVGIVAFRDETLSEPSHVLDFGNGPFTRDYSSFRFKMAGLVADGGGDPAESSYDALRVAAQQPFRERATKVLLLITDAPPQVPDRNTRSASEVVQELRQRGISQLHAVISPRDRGSYVVLQEACPGEVFDLDAVATGGGNFDSILPILGERIAEATVRGLASTSAVRVEYAPRQLMVTGLWTALLAAGVAASLVASQNTYLRKPAFVGWQVPAAAVLGLAVGGCSGALAQLIGLAPQFLTLRGDSASTLIAATLGMLGSIAGWALLGGLVGRGLAIFVPNLRPLAAVVGGLLGGVLGVAGFAVISSIVGDTGGRLLGAATLGLCIGLMIAIAEAAARNYFLEVRYGARETIRVSLGATPVTVGSDGRTATVFVASAPRPLMYKYWVDDHGVNLLDYSTECMGKTNPGDERTVGNATLTVRAGGQPGIKASVNSPTSGSPPPPPPPPPSKNQSKAIPPSVKATVSAPPKTQSMPANASPAVTRNPPPPPPPPPPRK